MAMSESHICFRLLCSIRHGTWFQQSNLNFMEVLFLMYDIVRRVSAHIIQQEHQFGSAAITDWAKLYREVILNYVLGSSQTIGGPNKTVEIDDRKIGRCKYNGGHKIIG
jgi:hypothetical protein